MRGMDFLDLFSNWSPSHALFAWQAIAVGFMFAASPLPNLIGRWMDAWAEATADKIIAASSKTGSAPFARDQRE